MGLDFRIMISGFGSQNLVPRVWISGLGSMGLGLIIWI